MKKSKLTEGTLLEINGKEVLIGKINAGYYHLHYKNQIQKVNYKRIRKLMKKGKIKIIA